MLEGLLAIALTLGGAFSARSPRETPNPFDYEVSGYWRAKSLGGLVKSDGRLLYERENGQNYRGRIWKLDATFFVAEEIMKEADEIDRQTFSFVYPMSLDEEGAAWEWLKKFELSPGAAVTTERYRADSAEGQGVVKLSYKVPWRKSINEVLWVKAVGSDDLEYIEGGIDWKIPLGKHVNLVPLLAYYYEPVVGVEAKESLQAKLSVEWDILKIMKVDDE